MYFTTCSLETVENPLSVIEKRLKTANEVVHRVNSRSIFARLSSGYLACTTQSRSAGLERFPRRSAIYLWICNIPDKSLFAAQGSRRRLATFAATLFLYYILVRHCYYCEHDCSCSPGIIMIVRAPLRYTACIEVTYSLGLLLFNLRHSFKLTERHRFVSI